MQLSDKFWCAIFLLLLDHGASENPCSFIYQGSSAMSEKEVQNLDRFLKSQLKRLAGFLDVHSYSQMWMIPWGFAKENIKDYDELVSYSNPFANLVYDYSERGLHRLFVHFVISSTRCT